MPKTGSTSIQQTLHRADLGPDLSYVSAETGNGSPMILAAFAPKRVPPIDRLSGLSDDKIARIRECRKSRLHAALKETSTPKLILSAEAFMMLTQPQLAEAFALFRDAATDVRVIGYARAPKSLAESEFAWRIGVRPTRFPTEVRRIRYFNQFSRFIELTGQDSIVLRKFDRQSLVAGDVVRDFLAQVGLSLDPSQIVQANERMKLRAAQLMYFFRLIRPQAGGEAELKRRLGALGGPPLRFHSTLARQIVSVEPDDLAWIGALTGADLTEDWERDDAIGLRSEADFLRLDEETLDWLAQNPDVPLRTLLQRPEAVGHAVARLRPSSPIGKPREETTTQVAR